MDILDNRTIHLSPVHPIQLENAEEYLLDIDTIRYATTGNINAWDSNRFFEEATQMLINAIALFEQGFFDAAFYSMRESIEISIGTLYLTANRNKLKEWQQQKNGFDNGVMAKFLREHEETFKEMREKMKPFFDNVWNKEMKINKYVHKQGFDKFYIHLWNKNDYQKRVRNIKEDFESYLAVCIGAVAVYRLALDAMPIALMDEDLLMRSPDLLTQPYTDDLVNKYIGKEAITSYKKTSFYQAYREFLSNRPKQNEAVFNLIHYQLFERKYIDSYISQLDQLSLTDRIAAVIFSSSDKISQLYVNGLIWYFSDIKPSRKDRSNTYGSNYFEQFFPFADNFNVDFKGVYLSRINIHGDYTYIEHNAWLDEHEQAFFRKMAVEMTDKIEKEENVIKSKL